MKPRILVTGSSGRLGRAAVVGLSENWHVVGFDRVPPAADQPAEFIRGTLTDAVAVQAAMASVECVLHLAAAPDDDPGADALGAFPADGDNFLADLVPANIVGVYHILKGCVRAGVKRVILASSGQVIDGHLADRKSRVDSTTPFAPRYLYASTKVFLEAAGRVVAKEHGLNVLAVRLGWCPRPGQEEAIKKGPLSPWVYLSGEDAGRFAAAAAGSPHWPTTTDADGWPVPFGVVYVTSKSPDGHEMYDLGPARRMGYEPKDDWAGWLDANSGASKEYTK